ncbi:MAG TPA: hypothetical protein VFM13_11485 [Gaiellaceae bacterium]|nr:hypothetical protein [Gaiellaceae bacterium]
MAIESPSEKGGFPASRPRIFASDYSLSFALVLSGVLLLAFVVRFLLAREIATPWIMADELIYSELAKNFVETGDFLVRDAPSHLNNVLYPVLIAPAWLAVSIETAYDVAKAINVVLMMLATVPVYLWGRRLMSPGYALIAPALVLLMPGMTYTGMLMTENAFFTAVVTACFAIALTLERPTLFHQALALGAIGLACAVRPQALVLLAIYVAALALKLGFDLRTPDGPRGIRYVLAELRRFLPSGLALALLMVGYVVDKSVRGDGLESGLGAYGGVVKVEYDFANARAWVLDHFAEIGLSVAVVPVSALIVLFGLAVLGWALSAAERAFVAVAASTFVLLVAEVGVYASRFALRIEERNMFAATPLLFLALALWLARGLPRPALLTAIAALVPAALLVALDLTSLLNIGILSDTFGLIPLYRLSAVIDGGVATVEDLMVAGGFAVGLAFALLPRRPAAVILPSIVAVFLVVSSYYVFGSVRDQARATVGLVSASRPSWIDEQIGPESDAAFVYGGTADFFGDAQILWQTEFWNRSVGTVYNLGPPDAATHLPNPARFDYVTGRLVPAPGTRNPPIRYVVVPYTVTLRGQQLVQEGPLSLYRVQGPLQLATHIGGIYPDSWMADFAAFTHYAKPRRPGRLRVRVSRAGWGGESPPGKVTISVGKLANVNGAPGINPLLASRTWTVRSGATREFTLPTPGYPYRLEIRVTPTFTPAAYGQADIRQLGAQIQLGA